MHSNKIKTKYGEASLSTYFHEAFEFIHGTICEILLTCNLCVCVRPCLLGVPTHALRRESKASVPGTCQTAAQVQRGCIALRRTSSRHPCSGARRRATRAAPRDSKQSPSHTPEITSLAVRPPRRGDGALKCQH